MSYPSDLSDKQWDLIKSHFNTGNYGKSRKHSKKELVNAALYIVKTRCQWHFLPKEYPLWKTVYSFYKRAKDKEIWEKMMKNLVQKSQVKMKRTQGNLIKILLKQNCVIPESRRVQAMLGLRATYQGSFCNRRTVLDPGHPGSLCGKAAVCLDPRMTKKIETILMRLP